MNDRFRFPFTARRNGPVSALAALLCGAVACGEDGADTSPTNDGAVDAGSSGPPDYAAAFPQDRVPRLDITIAAADWQAMIDDMTRQRGEFGGGGTSGAGFPTGSGGDGAMSVPPELVDACSGLAPGDPCSATLMGVELTGSCTEQASELACVPASAPGGGDAGTDLIEDTPIYVPCDVTDGEYAWRHVGVRFKGNSSLAVPWQQGVWKLPLRLKFDEYEDEYPETEDQRFYGFKALSLSNGAMDQSLLRDKLGTEVFVAAGIPAPATAFYRVYIDHGSGATYFGLYTGIEIPSDNAFLDTHFGGHEGNLYKPDGETATWASWDEEGLGKENHEDEADYSDAWAMFDALHASRDDAAAWRAALEATFDVEGFLHWLALNTVIQDWDTYGRMSHNYYLYADPAQSGELHWIPWDHSFAFSSEGSVGGSPLSLGLTEVDEQWPLIRFLLDDEVYKARYDEYVAGAVTSEYTVNWATERFEAAHALIAPYVVGDEGEEQGYTFLTSDDAFEQSLDELISHASRRAVDVADYLDK